VGSARRTVFHNGFSVPVEFFDPASDAEILQRIAGTPVSVERAAHETQSPSCRGCSTRRRSGANSAGRAAFGGSRKCDLTGISSQVPSGSCHHPQNAGLTRPSRPIPSRRPGGVAATRLIGEWSMNLSTPFSSRTGAPHQGMASKPRSSESSRSAWQTRSTSLLTEDNPATRSRPDRASAKGDRGA